MAKTRLENITICLVGTKYPGNIGAAARAMRNMGIRHLRLARPQCPIDEEAVRMARGGNEILEAGRRYRSLKSALRGVSLVIGTSGKTGGNRDQAENPRRLAPRILEVAAEHKVAIVFGPEDTGLVDDDLLLCQMLLRIPTDHRARSLNLAQAVLIVCYELYLAQLPRAPSRTPRLAPAAEVEAMYGHLETALREVGFLHDQNARHMMFRLRRLFGRCGLERPDVTVLRGIARQIAWHGAQKGSPRNRDG
ncbi:MAG: RNA methyltransferase [Acidobacteria bacterium]|nr:RNA methyltransferase [Acidobacteriota bacterium]